MTLKKIFLASLLLVSTNAFAAAIDDEKLIISVEALEDINNPLHVLNKSHKGEKSSHGYTCDQFGNSLDNVVKPIGKDEDDYELTFEVNGVKYGVVFMRLMGQTEELNLSSVMKALNVKTITGYDRGRRHWEAQDTGYKNKGILVLDRLSPPKDLGTTR